MAPKIHYDAAEMQVKANQAAEKEIRILAREGTELPRSAEVTCEYLGMLKDDGFTDSRSRRNRHCGPPLGTSGLIVTTQSTSATRKRPATITP